MTVSYQSSNFDSGTYNPNEDPGYCPGYEPDFAESLRALNALLQEDTELPLVQPQQQNFPSLDHPKPQREHPQARPARVQECMDDKTLVYSFVKGFMQSQSLLLCNSNLRTEPVCGSVQLLSKKEGVLATAQMHETPLTVLVKQKTSYWSLVHTALVEACYFPLPKNIKDVCFKYQHREIPAGYEVHCTSAKELWRVCWGSGHAKRYGIPMDLLIFSQGSLQRKSTWHPIKGMDSRDGRLFIKLLGGEESFGIDDLVVWLKKSDNAPTSPYDRSSHRGIRPDLRAYVRPSHNY
uniref:Uncharacterized protein n=1 Tax=Cyanothece sp. (strain PCC 7425 / ATCC 29141) TaxID=395961 RepID=B8HXI9_CYAP4